MGRVAEIKKAALVVSARVINLDGGEKRIFHFILIARSRRKVRQKKTRLSSNIGAILFGTGIPGKITKLKCRNRIGTRRILRAECVRIRGEEALCRILADSPVVRLRPADLVVPMLAEREIP